MIRAGTITRAALLALAAAACDDGAGPVGDDEADAAGQVAIDASEDVVDAADALADAGGDVVDAAAIDAASPPDASDEPPDAAPPDAAPPDAEPAPPDAAPPPPDAAPPPPGLSHPCANGPGWTLFAFHYGNGSTSPSIDVWDATCDYSLAPGSACNVVGVGSISTVMNGSAVLVDGGDYLRARFSVAGLAFTGARVYVQARSYATSSSTSVRVWSPLYGDRVMGPVDNDFVYDWYGMDWSDKLDPSDAPALTAIQIYAYQGSGSLAVHAVELCVE